ncbi:cadherin repeat domain-containing protein, partial [Mycoplana rhizolycopersici]
VKENVAVGTTVGTLSAKDPEGKALTYTLTDNAGGLFKLSGNRLVTAKAIDYEAVKSGKVTVEVSDGVNKVAKSFTIAIQDVDDVDKAPTSLSLSKSTVKENVKTGTTVGTFSAKD